jgi:hypothetical protein
LWAEYPADGDNNQPDLDNNQQQPGGAELGHPNARPARPANDTGTIQAATKERRSATKCKGATTR